MTSCCNRVPYLSAVHVVPSEFVEMISKIFYVDYLNTIRVFHAKPLIRLMKLCQICLVDLCLGSRSAVRAGYLVTERNVTGKSVCNSGTKNYTIHTRFKSFVKSSNLIACQYKNTYRDNKHTNQTIQGKLSVMKCYNEDERCSDGHSQSGHNEDNT